MKSGPNEARLLDRAEVQLLLSASKLLIASRDINRARTPKEVEQLYEDVVVITTEVGNAVTEWYEAVMKDES